MSIISATIKCVAISLAALPVRTRLPVQAMTADHQHYLFVSFQHQRAFDVDTPNETWVTDIRYIRTHEGWLYLLPCVGCSTQPVPVRTLHSTSVQTMIRFFVTTNDKPTYEFLESKKLSPPRIHQYHIPSLCD